MTVSNHIGDKYSLLSHTSMWQIRLLVFVRKELRHNITNVGKSKVRVDYRSFFHSPQSLCILRIFQEMAIASVPLQYAIGGDRYWKCARKQRRCCNWLRLS